MTQSFHFNVHTLRISLMQWLKETLSLQCHSCNMSTKDSKVGTIPTEKYYLKANFIWIVTHLGFHPRTEKRLHFNGHSLRISSSYSKDRLIGRTRATKNYYYVAAFISIVAFRTLSTDSHVFTDWIVAHLTFHPWTKMLEPDHRKVLISYSFYLNGHMYDFMHELKSYNGEPVP